MNKTMHKQHYYKLLLAGLLSFGLTAVYAQDENNEDEEIGEVFELSPFEVDTTSDRGYYAANTISGSRINIALQDMPMPIEVITSEFIEDTGSTDLRESLRYSSGIILNSQSPSDGLEGVPGGVHNGAGATANITDTTIKVRGFITDSSLRKGFRRQHGSDSVNIDRIEVVRGPAALLYGIGNFGGIVNYLPKRPLTFKQTTTALTIGNDAFLRATLDTTAPVNDQLSYRVTAAAEQGDDWTEWNNHEKLFVSPVFVYKPFEKTKITVDYEVGTETTNGVGFQRMRARATGLDAGQVITQQGRLQKSGFVIFDGIDSRTARLSGPDTYVQTDSANILLELEQNIFDGLDLMIGYNRADADVEILDITANAYNSGLGPTGLRNTVTIEPFVDQRGNPVYDNEITGNNEVDDVILMYQWKEEFVGRMREEIKAELTYNLALFQESRWFNMSHTVLAGYSDLTQEKGVELWLTGGGGTEDFLYRDPYDFNPIRFGEGILDDGSVMGTPGFPDLVRTRNELSIAGDEATYVVWQGRFLNDRITAIAGQRRDENTQNITLNTYTNGDLSNTTVQNPAPQKETTSQYGVTVEVIDGVSVFALRAQGLEPNFDGWRDGYGNPINGKIAESEELGVKLNLFNGKVAATISTYKINVVGPTSIGGGGLWWAPAPAKGRYNPNEPTVYQLSEVERGGDGTWYAWGGVGNNPAFEANRGAWEAAVAAGDVFIGSDNQTYLTVLNANGGDTAGAAFMDGMYAWTAAGNGWPMWMFHASPNPQTLANNAAMDWAAGDVDFFAYMVGEEESRGTEFQVLISPTDNWQIYMSYAHTEREIINQGKMPQYPYPQDRWAIWYFPDGNWGLQGASKEQAYGDPQDTSTWTGGPASTNGESLDDTPEHDFSLWTSYTFADGPVEGLKVGLGSYYQSEREYLSGFTVGGDAITDQSGQRIKLYTPTKLHFGCMFRYDFELKDSPAWVQLNVDNLTNDKDLYGYVYEAGRSFRLQGGITF